MKKTKAAPEAPGRLRVSRLLNANLGNENMEIKVRYQVVHPSGPKGGRRIHKAGCR